MTWTEYITGHFYALKMRPVSAFDPSGFMILIAVVVLVVGISLASARSVIQHKSDRFRSTVEKNLLEVQEYIAQGKDKFDEQVKYIKGRAIVQTHREGFTAEMLSKAYLSRLAVSIAMFVGASYLNALAAVVAGWRTPRVEILDLNGQITGEKTLPDLGHDIFKAVMTKFYGQTTYIEWFDLPDHFIAAVATVSAGLLILHPRRLLILRRMCAIYGCINFMRAFCVVVTSLPDASPMCISQFGTDKGVYKSMPMFPRAFIRGWKVLTRPSQHITCGDMVFSGHTIFLMICSMFVYSYCVREELNTPFTRKHPHILWIIRYYVYICSAAGIFAIIGTRLHYTLDVLIAMYIATQVWFTYHWFCAHPDCGFRIVRWLEHEEVHSIDRESYRKARRTSSTSELDKAVAEAEAIEARQVLEALKSKSE